MPFAPTMVPLPLKACTSGVRATTSASVSTVVENRDARIWYVLVASGCVSHATDTVATLVDPT